MTVGRIHRGVPTKHKRSSELQVSDHGSISRVTDGTRAPLASYDDLHNYFGWPPPGHNTPTVYDSSTTQTIRSMSHERTDTPPPPEASYRQLALCAHSRLDWH